MWPGSADQHYLVLVISLLRTLLRHHHCLQPKVFVHSELPSSSMQSELSHLVIPSTTNSLPGLRLSFLKHGLGVHDEELFEGRPGTSFILHRRRRASRCIQHRRRRHICPYRRQSQGSKSLMEEQAWTLQKG
ncbi:hypothetical protein IWX47DRAFT_51551 [Phyllosticta citricarpa]